jgi:two-component system, OmpR family, phosphate regulon sensor histidine kinase PhoR
LLNSLSARIAIAYAALIVVCVGALSIYLLLVGQAPSLAVFLDGAGSEGRAILLGGLVAIGLAVVLALVVAKSVTAPIKELTAVASRMAEGDLDQRVGNYSQDEVGRLARAVETMADHLRANIKAVSAERNTLSTILSTMADGLLIVDGRGLVVMANRAAGILLQAPTSTMAGRSYVEVLRDHELTPVLRSCLEEGTQKSGTAWVGPNRRFLRLVATPLGSGQEGALAIIQDLSEVRRVETVRRDFIANVSHELRTPLTSLKAIVETLEEGAIAEPDVARDFLSKMHSEVDGIAHLVGELLELSRIESGQAALKLKALSVEMPLRRATARLEAQADRAGLRLEVQLSPELPAVRADEERIERVLVNLIHNAIKFTPPDGTVSVGAREGKGEVVVWVADTGVGIDPADLSRIFERFYKADRSRAEGGTGLGLAIVKHLIQAHGGRIWAESTEGAGSTFYFTLPVLSVE